MKWGAFYRQSKNLRYLHNRRQTTGSHTEEEWQTLCSFFHVCPRCHEETTRFTKDHIIPLSRGGTDNIWNLQPLCLRCNIQKSNIYEVDYRTDEAKKWVQRVQI